MSSGIYFYSLKANDLIETRKMVLWNNKQAIAAIL